MPKKFDDLVRQVKARPGAAERMAAEREAVLEEIRVYELCHAQAVSQAELAGRLEVTQGAISKFEHADDVRVSTLREYLDAPVPAWNSWPCSTTTIGSPSNSAGRPRSSIRPFYRRRAD